MNDVVRWTSPAPLWRAAAAAGATAERREQLRRPALLRFASDTFMEDLIALLENDPARLADKVARYETWRDTVKRPEAVEAVPKFALPLRRLRLAGERRKAATALALSGGAPAPPAFAGLAVSSSAAAKTLKLYQPAHQRYYLVAAGLVCARAGLPDRTVNAGRGERASFVVRRLLPAAVRDPKTGALVPFVDPQTGQVRREIPLPKLDETWEEYAFVTTPEGDAGWRKVVGAEQETAGALAAGEDQLPLFNLGFTDDEGRRRRVLAGLVPVGRREAYMTAAHLPQQTPNGGGDNGQPSSPAVPDAQNDPRALRLRLEVTEPWKRLLERADALRIMQYPHLWQPANVVQTPSKEDGAMTAAGLAASLKAAREQIQTGSWYVLLDLAAFLEKHLNRVWQVILNPTATNVASLGVNTPARAAYEAIKSASLVAWRRNALVVSGRYPLAKVMPNMADALREIARTDVNPSAATLLEGAETSYDRERGTGWPAFLFPLAHTELSTAPGESDIGLGPLPSVAFAPADTELRSALRRVSAFAVLIDRALAPLPAEDRPVPAARPAAAQQPLDLREGYFRLRCVYERPLCGPIDPPVVSEPTREFQLAGYFDPDAPARPLRIALPVDTTPAGLRKFDKNAAFLMSDILCGQVNRVKGLSLGDLVRSVLPWPLHKDLSVPDTGPCKGDDPALQIGMICSLSLPIITICALLLLMIIVTLLDFIFRWIPYFMICFPLPGFKAKSD